MKMVGRFFRDLFGAYADGFRVAWGLPWLTALLVLWEFGQHVMEIRIGFFDSVEASKAVGLDSSRMVLGWIKMFLVYAGGFYAIRYVAWGSGARAMRAPASAMLRYLPYMAYALAMFAIVYYARSFVPSGQVMLFRMVVSLAQLAVEPLLILWIVSAATGGAVRGPLQSVRLTGWWYLWALPMFFIARIPINAAHQLLNSFAMGQPKPVVWAMMTLDAVVVALLIFIVPAIYVRIVRVIAERPAREAALARQGAIGA